MEEQVTQQPEQEKKPNPYWVKINKLDEQIKIISKKLEIIEKSLRRNK